MHIKKLVISGGGVIGLQYLGALTYLNENQTWKIEDIECIYGTSVGSILGAFLCLKYDWETLNKYIIERPWHEAFPLSGKQIFDAYHTKGLYDKKLAEIVFKPLLEAKDLNLSITLKEFYDFSKIEFHLYTFELNSFKTVDLSYKTHPDLSLMEAITMSSAIPVLFMPTCTDDNCCYIDGGVMANYPLSFCLDDTSELDVILGFNTKDRNECGTKANVNKNSTILDFIVGFSMNAMNFITNTIQCDKIPNEIIFKSDRDIVSFDTIKEFIHSMDMRRSYLELGKKIAKDFLDHKS